MCWLKGLRAKFYHWLRTQQTTGKCPEIDELNHMLERLQENGLVEPDIININDESQLLWAP